MDVLTSHVYVGHPSFIQILQRGCKHQQGMCSHTTYKAGVHLHVQAHPYSCWVILQWSKVHQAGRVVQLMYIAECIQWRQGELIGTPHCSGVYQYIYNSVISHFLAQTAHCTLHTAHCNHLRAYSNRTAGHHMPYAIDTPLSLRLHIKQLCNVRSSCGSRHGPSAHRGKQPSYHITPCETQCYNTNL